MNNERIQRLHKFMRDFKRFMRDNHYDIDDNDIQWYLRGLVQFNVKELKERIMDYEKKYKEALERAREYHKVDYDNTMKLYAKGTMEYLFPELEDIDDEKIRKEMLEYCHKRMDNEFPSITILQVKRWLAWLEKQGKNNMGISEATKQKLEDSLHKALEKETPESLNEFLDKQKLTDEEMKILLQTEYEKGRADAIEQKFAWSEEDIKALNRISTILVDASEVKNWWKEYRLIKREEMIRLTNFLKSLIDRIHPQPTEWSEEDENRFRNLVYLVEHSEEGIGTKRGFIKFINRLKSLKDKVQPQWKPSDEQMYILNWVINVFLNQKSIVEQSVSNKLQSLYNELKKLKKK